MAVFSRPAFASPAGAGVWACADMLASTTAVQNDSSLIMRSPFGEVDAMPGWRTARAAEFSRFYATARRKRSGGLIIAGKLAGAPAITAATDHACSARLSTRPHPRARACAR